MDADGPLNEAWALGPLRVPNRVMLAPLAGIGNWFVRLQAKRYGAGMAVSEMVSSHAIHHRNRRTCEELLRIDERERAGGPTSIQLFGEDADVMRSAAATVAARGADAIDLNMGCPVPKVRKTGAGAALLADPDRAVALARAAAQGVADAGAQVPVTVKLRSGLTQADADSGLRLAHRLVAEAGVSAIALHPRSASSHHRGEPDYSLVARLVESLPAPVILTGGLRDAAAVRAAHARTGASAVMLARGALGNPWLFSELLAGREEPPSAQEVLVELHWTMDRAVEHLGEGRATHYLRKFYPWYLARLPMTRARRLEVLSRMQEGEDLEGVRRLLLEACEGALLAA